MPNEPMIPLLRALRQELATPRPLDAETRQLLSLVAADIEKLGVGAAATPHGLEALAVRFEVDHPSMSAALRQVADLLGKAGI